jgi:hypothetical protein
MSHDDAMERLRQAGRLWDFDEWPCEPDPQPDMIGMLREWRLDQLAREADEQAQRDRLRAWVIEQTGPDGVPVKDWMEDE